MFARISNLHLKIEKFIKSRLSFNVYYAYFVHLINLFPRRIICSFNDFGSLASVKETRLYGVLARGYILRDTSFYGIFSM